MVGVECRGADNLVSVSEYEREIRCGTQPLGARLLLGDVSRPAERVTGFSDSAEDRPELSPVVR